MVPGMEVAWQQVGVCAGGVDTTNTGDIKRVQWA